MLIVWTRLRWLEIDDMTCLFDSTMLLYFDRDITTGSGLAECCHPYRSLNWDGGH